jgi:hypothetical protein
MYLLKLVLLSSGNLHKVGITSVSALAELQNENSSFSMSVCTAVCPHGTNRLPLDVFSWNLIFEDFSKICPEKYSFIKIWQE